MFVTDVNPSHLHFWRFRLRALLTALTTFNVSTAIVGWMDQAFSEEVFRVSELIITMEEGLQVERTEKDDSRLGCMFVPIWKRYIEYT